MERNSTSPNKNPKAGNKSTPTKLFIGGLTGHTTKGTLDIT
jgi:hypothetical protein